MLSFESAGSVASISRSHEGDPFCLITFENFGLDRNHLLRLFESDASSLEWDWYDVRRFQRELLLSALPEARHEVALLNDFYAGHQPVEKIRHLVARLNREDQDRFRNRAPHRRRTVSRFLIEHGGAACGWNITRKELEPLRQNVPESDIRSIPRQFKESNERISDDLEFRKFLCGIASLAKSLSVKPVQALEVLSWHSELVAQPFGSASNAPEGIHQDGADFIVSALVLDKVNAEGGTSRIYGPDKRSVLLSHTLEVGSGIFQADSGSTLWHDITPITPRDPARGAARRRTLGLDITVN